MQDGQRTGERGVVLIVDDVESKRLLLSGLLTREGYEIHTASNGAAALHLVGSVNPDVILLDIGMPDMDGYEVCQRLKADERTRLIPIIFISVLDTTETKVHAFSAGAADYMNHPFQREELLARVSTQISMHRTLNTLRESETCYRLLADNATDMISRHRPDGTYNYVSPACEKLLGWQPDDLLGSSLYTLLHPDDIAEVQDTHRMICETGATVTISYHIRHKDGTYIYFETTNKCVSDQQTGAVSEIIAISRDISAHRKTEDELLKLYRAVEQSSSSIVITDIKGIIEYVNPKFTQVTGYSAAEAIGQNPRILKAGDMPPEEYQRLWQAISVGQAWHGEFHNKRKNGEDFWELASISPIWNIDGEITHYLAVKEDITARKQAEAEVLRINEQLTRSLEELEQRNREMHILNRMNDFLQRSQTLDEAYAVGIPLLRELFAGQVGALYMLNRSTQTLDLVSSWGDPPPLACAIVPGSCWAFSGQRVHMVESMDDEMLCDHLADEQEALPCICVQLTLRGEPLGLLHLRQGPLEPEQAREHWERLAMVVADHLSLSLSNLQLREHLYDQTIRDPLTGLFNRRYLDETLNRELHRAQRQQYPLSVVILDIDHFKRYNDTNGHDGGDAVLQTLGSLLQQSIRSEDIACRYGGEEFVLILPGASLEDTRTRSEALRREIEQMHQTYTHHYAPCKKPLEPITASFGVASFPNHGSTPADLIAAADSALYRAKDEGRNRVYVAEQVHEGG